MVSRDLPVSACLSLGLACQLLLRIWTKVFMIAWQALCPLSSVPAHIFHFLGVIKLSNSNSQFGVISLMEKSREINKNVLNVKVSKRLNTPWTSKLLDSGVCITWHSLLLLWKCSIIGFHWLWDCGCALITNSFVYKSREKETSDQCFFQL